MLKNAQIAALLACVVVAGGASGAETGIRRFDGKTISSASIDREATRMMAKANVQGLAMAVIDEGKVVFVRSWAVAMSSRSCRFRPTRSCTVRL